MINSRTVCWYSLHPTFEFTKKNALNGIITHNALRLSRRQPVATIITDDSYFTGYSLSLTYILCTVCLFCIHYEKGLLSRLGKENNQLDYWIDVDPVSRSGFWIHRHFYCFFFKIAKYNAFSTLSNVGEGLSEKMTVKGRRRVINWKKWISRRCSSWPAV